MIPTRRQLLTTGAVAAGAAATLTACTTPVAVAPKRHTYSLQTLNGFRRDLVVCDAAGHNPTDIVQSVYGRASWTPDGQHLVVARGALYESIGTWALWVVRSDGNLLHRITNPPLGVADLDPSFGPDGTSIVFSRDTIGFGYGAGLWIVQADGSGFHFVPGGAGGIQPGFNNNGGAIVYAAFDGIRRIPTAGGPSRLIVAATVGWQFSQPTWSPDGKKVAFVRHDSSTAASICYVNAVGGAVSVLKSIPANIECPTWSTDSATLTYAVYSGIGSEGRGPTTTVFRQVIGGPAVQAFHPLEIATDLSTWAG